MDISLFSCDPSQCQGNDGNRAQGSDVRPKMRRRMAFRQGVRHSTAGASDRLMSEPIASNPRLRRRTLSSFRWRSAPDVVVDSLKGMRFTISGTLDCLTHEDVVELIESCGGTVYKTLAKKSDYLIAGTNASHKMVNEAYDSSKTVLNEKEFLDLVRDKGKALKEALNTRYREPKPSSGETSDDSNDCLQISSDCSEN